MAFISFRYKLFTETPFTETSKSPERTPALSAGENFLTSATSKISSVAP